VFRISPGNLHWYVSRFPGMNSLVVTAIRELEYSQAVWSVVRAIQKEQPFDLLEGTETGSVCAALWGGDLPLVIRLHGDPFTFAKYTPDLKVTPGLRLSRILQRIALRRCRALISPSVSHLREISTELHGSHPPIEVIPNAVGEMTTASRTTSPQLSEVLASPAPMVLYVGRIEKCKGVPMLLQAAALVHRTLPQCRFVLAGAPHPTLSSEELRGLIQRLDLGDFVTFLGHVPHDQLPSLYACASVSVVPSHYETFGLSALESMKFGVPVVAAAAGSLPEVVLDGVTGLLVPPGDAAALAKAIVRLVGDRKAHDEFAERAREHAQRYNVDRQAPHNLDLYEWASSPDLHGAKDTEHIFFSAHPDDVALSCGGFVDSLVRKDRRVRVVTVFASGVGAARESAFARHLRSKWGPTAERRKEDLQALKALGVQRVDHWEFADAPWRTSDAGHSLYTSYEELSGPIDSNDFAISYTLRSFMDASLRDVPSSAILYFPLSIGGHVDHRHLSGIGVRLRAAGRNVRFYEDWPYAEGYALRPASSWFSRTVPIDTARKVAAIRQYDSQVPGLGGASDELRRRVERFTHHRGTREAAERYWEISVNHAAAIDGPETGLDHPFQKAEVRPRLRDFREFLRTLSWRELESCLPVGDGICVDAGCGFGRHRAAIEKKGYTWIGTDRDAEAGRGLLQSDCHAPPFAARSAAAVIAWQVMEYTPKIETVVSEAHRVLEYGGLFCGSVLFLEPLHGQTLWGTSPLGIRLLLKEHGFRDIQIVPGLSAFSLMTWTALRRFLGPWAGRLALPLTAAWLTPLAAVRFLASWAAYKLGIGTGHGMRWVTQQAPLEFAGQVVFTARRGARTES
jgi:glycosyltransferase involved in cell wall biosynthesis/LmbE family N-acetylglucosaminyl deacetylase